MICFRALYIFEGWRGRKGSRQRATEVRIDGNESRGRTLKLMISTDFAPNEELDDALLSLKLLWQPWRWKTGKELNELKKVLFPNLNVSLFLTGRSALFHLLKTMRLPKNSEILIQAFTCEAVVLPILANSLKAVYVDIEKKTFSMNPIELERRIGPSSRVVILQHTFGLTPAQRAEIHSVVKKHNLVLIEDIAHGYNKDKIADRKSQIGNSYLLMSFGRSKAISSVFGGAVVSQKPLTINLNMPSKLFIFRALLYKPLTYFIKKTYYIYLGKIIHKILLKLNFLIPEITTKEKGGNFDHWLDKAYPNAFAILLLNQLDKLSRAQKQRARTVSLYNHYFSGNSYEGALLRYPLLIANRNQIIAKLAKKNIFLGNWYEQVVAPIALNLDRVGYKKGNCPVAEELSKKIINLPTNISLKEAEKVVKTLNDVL